MGIVLANFLPSGQVTNENRVITNSPDFDLYATLGFAVAYILSVIIEAAVLKLVAGKVGIRYPVKLSLYSNTASYIVLSIMVWLIIKYQAYWIYDIVWPVSPKY